MSDKPIFDIIIFFFKNAQIQVQIQILFMSRFMLVFLFVFMFIFLLHSLRMDTDMNTDSEGFGSRIPDVGCRTSDIG
jgi:hypothetical protein